MKSKITKHKPVIPKMFPKLITANNISHIGNTIIVLAYEEGKGQLMYASMADKYNRKIGEYYNDWDMLTFKEFNGKVTLEN